MSDNTTYLLATDGSEPARNAEDYLVRTADPDRDKIIVLSVYDPSIVMGGYEFTSEERTGILDTERLLSEIELKTDEQVSACENRLAEAGFNVETDVLRGNPGVGICTFAKERDVDAVVMGRSGAGAVTEILLGSVSSYVVHHTDRPVVLVPGSA